MVLYRFEMLKNNLFKAKMLIRVLMIVKICIDGKIVGIFL